MLLGEILRLTAQRSPTKTALIAGDRQLTFHALDNASNRFAHFLLKLQIQKGDRIATLLFNTPEYVAIHFGNARVGSILVHISPMYAGPEIARILQRTSPRVLLFDANLGEKIPQIINDIPSIEHVIAIDKEFDSDINSMKSSHPKISIEPTSAVAMTFTGGTTGQPKGAVVSHNARFVSAWTTALEHRLTAQDIAGVVTPMFHAVSLMIWYQATVLAGCTAVLFRKWNPTQFIHETEKHSISSVFMVPVQIRDLLRSDSFTRKRLKTLKNISAGGAPTPEGLIVECKESLPHCGYTDHYGQSETGPLTFLKPWEAISHPGSIGQAAVGVEIRIVDEHGKNVPSGTVGELICRGPFLMEGYFEDEIETNQYFRSGDTWGWSGDLAIMDEEGFITLTGRSKEMIVSGGINIYPREVELVLENHPAVEECTVFGVPDQRWGEALIGYVVLVSEANVSRESLQEYCATQLARYKRPRQIVFVTNIPKTPSGKVQKPQLRSAFLEGKPLDK